MRHNQFATSSEPESGFERRDETEPILQKPRHQEAPPHAFLRPRAQPLAQFIVLDNLHDPLGCLLDTVDEKAVLTIFDLMLNPAGSASDDHRALPHRLGHREAETLPERLLQNNCGTALQRVHECRILDRQDANPLLCASA